MLSRQMLLRIALSALPMLILINRPLSGQEGAEAESEPDSRQERQGSIHGKVASRYYPSPLGGVEVSIEGLDRIAITGSEGSYAFKDISVGAYTMRFALIGHRTHAVTDVIVKSQRITFINVELEQIPIEMEDIVVTGGNFPDDVSQPASVVGFSGEEIRRAPGAAGDVSRSVTALPSLAKVNDQKNSLIVRGGSPIENAFFVDNIEIPNINHFPTQGSTDGPIGLLNVDFIDDVTFRTGGFSASYGDRLSSVMDIQFRDGNREEFDGQFNLSIAGFGFVGEGPLFSDNASWMLSARRSYIDLLIDMIDAGTTVAPRWSDYQAKVSVDLSRNHSLTALGVFSDDHSHSDRDVAFENDMIVYGDQDISAATGGVNWRALWGGGVSNTALSYTRSRFDEDLLETSSGESLLENRSTEETVSLRNVNLFPVGRGSTIEFGVEAKWLRGDYDNSYGATFDALGRPLPARTVTETIDGFKLAAFGTLMFTPLDRLQLNVGLRADHLTMSGNTYVSPRLSFAYRLTERTSLTGATGIYSQGLPLILLAQNPANRELGDPRAVHFILGIDHRIGEFTRLTVEAYHKDYAHFPVDPSQPPLFVIDDLFGSYGFFTNLEDLTDGGEAMSTGIEVTAQKRLASGLYGLVSGSYFRSRYRGYDQVWRDRVFDNQVVVGLEGGYKPNRSWEFSARWIYAGGPPYTPFDLERSTELNRAVYDANRVNEERYPDYHSLNLRVDRRFHFGASNLIVYLSVWNAYNRKNIASFYWNGLTGEPGTIYQWGAIPIFGLEYEF